MCFFHPVFSLPFGKEWEQASAHKAVFRINTETQLFYSHSVQIHLQDSWEIKDFQCQSPQNDCFEYDYTQTTSNSWQFYIKMDSSYGICYYLPAL